MLFTCCKKKYFLRSDTFLLFCTCSHYPFLNSHWTLCYHDQVQRQKICVKATKDQRTFSKDLQKTWRNIDIQRLRKICSFGNRLMAAVSWWWVKLMKSLVWAQVTAERPFHVQSKTTVKSSWKFAFCSNLVGMEALKEG